MSWLKIESSVARNKKFMKAGPAPSWLWVCGLAYCQEGLTDGFIPTEALPYLGVKNAKQLTEHLVKAGLWDEVEGGWSVHDYLEHNRSASDVEAIRQSRAAGGNLGGRPRKNLAENLPVHVKVSQEGGSEKPSDKPQGLTPENPSTATATATDQQQLERVEPPSDSTPSVLVFPTVGKFTAWILTQGRIDGWARAYPSMDIAAECHRASAWIEAHRARRKTARGMPAFLVGWFNRTTDRPARRVESAPQGMSIPSAEETRRRYLTS